MKLTVGQIHEVVSALSSLEDPEIKLSGETILGMAITVSKLRHIAAAYEQARARVVASIVKGDQENNQEKEASILEQDRSLRDNEEDVDIKTIDVTALDLANNPKIRPIILARLMPILSGV